MQPLEIEGNPVSDWPMAAEDTAAERSQNQTEPPPDADGDADGHTAAPADEPSNLRRRFLLALSVALAAVTATGVFYLDGRTEGVELCQIDADCGKQAYCRKNAQRCYELPAFGERCAPEERCRQGLRCKASSLICTNLDPIADGEPCSHSHQCKENSLCTGEHVCRALPKKAQATPNLQTQ